MKCPRCDADITGKRKCSKCGLDFADSQEQIEVEYKDFKTSELLEIRHKKQAAHDFEGIKTAGEQKGAKALKEGPPGEALCKKDKKSFHFLAAIVLMLVLITGIFLIFRYFIMQ